MFMLRHWSDRFSWLFHLGKHVYLLLFNSMEPWGRRRTKNSSGFLCSTCLHLRVSEKFLNLLKDLDKQEWLSEASQQSCQWCTVIKVMFLQWWCSDHISNAVKNWLWLITRSCKYLKRWFLTVLNNLNKTWFAHIDFHLLPLFCMWTPLFLAAYSIRACLFMFWHQN